MPIKVLIVEDEDASLEETLALLAKVDPEAEVLVAADWDTALRHLEEFEFDLIICDLKIPPAPNDLDADEAHGLAVHAGAQALCPGTPLIFLTGKATPTNVQRQLSFGAVADFYGMGPTPLIQLAIKDGNRQEVGYITDMVDGLRSLQQCAIMDPDSSDLSELMMRAILTYAKRLSATEVQVASLSGLSGAEVARATFKMPNGQTRSILVKLQSLGAAQDEMRRYDVNVPNKLRLGYFASTAAPPLEHGLRKGAALYYSLASDTSSLFLVASEDSQTAASIIESMERDHGPWTSEHHVIEVNVGELRRSRLPDTHPGAARLLETPWINEVESMRVPLRVCTTHGDLHGLNVLVDLEHRATLIDYGDVGVSSAALDPITLEMSFLFHKEGPREANNRSLEQLGAWTDLGTYGSGSKYDPVLRACRAWAVRVAPPRTLYASAYAHAIRQLKYGDVDPDRAMAVARSAGLALLDLA